MAHLDFANRLSIYGYKWEVENFDYLLARVWWCYGFADTYLTVEGLLQHPTIALQFVESVRRDTELPNLLEQEILTRLMNLRKSGYLKDCKKDFVG